MDNFHPYVVVYELAVVDPIDASPEFLHGSFVKRAVEQNRSAVLSILRTPVRRKFKSKQKHPPVILLVSRTYWIYAAGH